MTEMTDRLDLPLLAAGQSQKEVTHNEALAQIDMLLHPVVEAVAPPVPPAAPQPGQGWIVGRAAPAAWQGKENALAVWTAAGWRFCPAFEGLSVWSRAGSRLLRYVGGRWSDSLEVGALRVGGRQVVGPQQPAIAMPSGGNAPDVPARTALAEIIVALQSHGLIAS